MEDNVDQWYSNFIDMLAKMVNSQLKSKTWARVTTVSSVEQIESELIQEDDSHSERYLTEKLLGTNDYLLVS